MTKTLVGRPMQIDIIAQGKDSVAKCQVLRVDKPSHVGHLDHIFGSYISKYQLS